MYVLVCIDIPLADQIVQAGHACLEAGFRFKKPDMPVHLIVICVASETELLVALDRIGLQGIKFVAFHEPDDGMGFTVACTEPLSAAYKREFRNFPLWKSPEEVIEP